MFAEKDQDEASLALAQSRQKAFTLGKTAWTAEGEKISFVICFAENIVRRVFSLLREAPTDQAVLSLRPGVVSGDAGNRSGGAVWAVTKASAGFC